MKKTLLTIICVAIVAVICLSVCLILARQNSADEETISIHLMPEGTEFLFGCTAEEFFNETFPFYLKTGDFRKSATVNERGGISLELTARQAKIWKKTDWLSPFELAKDSPDIEVSPDIKTMYVYYDSSTGVDFYESSCWDQNYDIIFSIMARCSTLQLLDGVPAEDIAVDLTIIDKATGETIYSDAYFSTETP